MDRGRGSDIKDLDSNVHAPATAGGTDRQQRFLESIGKAVTSYPGTVTEDRNPTHGRRGTFADFLESLLAFESGVDPAKFDWYVENYHSPLMSYPKVISPGLVVRDFETGDISFEMMTVQEYFTSLGVGELFEPGDPSCIRRMQYRVVNALGFVGYQLGEAILITTGYYTPEEITVIANGRAEKLERYYSGSAPTSLWQHGCHEARYKLPGSDKWIMATDVNCWRGTFTGKDKVHSFADVLEPDRQEPVLREIFSANYHCLNEESKKRGLSVQSALRRFYSSTNPEETRTYTLSGTLAAAHLCGPYGVLELFLSGAQAKDEFGTSIMQYLTDFADYETPYDLL